MYVDFLDSATDARVLDTLQEFYEAVVQPPLHKAVLQRRVGFVRHALGYLLCIGELRFMAAAPGRGREERDPRYVRHSGLQ